MLDHSAPPDISYANYRYYMDRLREASIPITMKHDLESP